MFFATPPYSYKEEDPDEVVQCRGMIWGLINFPGPQMTIGQLFPFSGTRHLFLWFPPLIILFGGSFESS